MDGVTGKDFKIQLGFLQGLNAIDCLLAPIGANHLDASFFREMARFEPAHLEPKGLSGGKLNEANQGVTPTGATRFRLIPLARNDTAEGRASGC